MRKLLWLAGLGLALFIVTAAAANAFLPADRSVSLRIAGHDFLAFYTGGTFVRTGEADKLYDLDAVRAFQHDLAQREGLELFPAAVGPFWNPPIYAWLFAPLSALPYRTAFWAWTILNLACLAGASGLLALMLASAAPRWRNWALVPLLTLTSAPLIMALGHGQNTCLSLLILCGAVALWRGGRFLAGGAVAGLLFYKPQLGAVVAGVMVICCGWRALAGLAMTGTALLATTLLSLPGTLEAFLAKVPANLAYMQVERPYLWERHVTLKAFWRLLVQGRETGETSLLTHALHLTSAALLAACLFACVWKFLRDQLDDLLARDRIISLTILSMPLLMPFYFDYDLLLLAVPATLAAREMIVRGQIDRPLAVAWALLYAWLMVNPHLAAATRVNGTVVLLATVAGVTMMRAMRRQSMAAITINAAAKHEHEPRRQAA